MWPLLTILLGLSVLCALPQDAIGECSLTFLSPNVPFVLTRFGSKHFVSHSAGVYERDEGEEIHLFCGSGFQFNKHRYDSNELPSIQNKTLTCQNGYFYDLKSNSVEVLEASCLRGALKMFESRTSLANCEEHMTLVLGLDFEDLRSVKNAALCFDILAAQMKYVAYTTIPKGNRIVEKSQLGQLNDLGLDDNVVYRKALFRTFSQEDIDTYVQDKLLFDMRSFEYANLVQDVDVGGSLSRFEGMLSIVWMRSLRTGNWKHWVTALSAATGSGAMFDLRLGVSGTLELPMAPESQCNGNRNLTIRSQSVPAQIWAHVRRLQPAVGDPVDPEEFVLIGQNSPFIISSDLCDSMCDQVSWLRTSLFASLHKFPAFGLVQCCHVKDVSHKLDNFPGPFVDVDAEEPVATTTTASQLLMALGMDVQ
ncbi:hypothetical protein KR009_004612 [Drosophila setifemur]|nr:hypothetical protein KR009_004612 [Drosophila setifemur]